MRISKISLSNFRSFKEKQEIDIAPVTLLFGPNSVGKSSVLMALAYVQQILEKGHCDPQKLDALGDKTIGGFRSLVHGGDLHKTIIIRLDLELGNTIYPTVDEDFDYLAERFNAEPLQLNEFSGSVEHFAFEISVAWSHTLEKAYVQSYQVWINQQFMGRISSSDDGKQTRISQLNLLHPLALTEIEHAQLQMTPEDWLTEFNTVAENIPELSSTRLESVLDELIPGHFTKSPGLHSLSYAGVRTYGRDVGVKCQWGAIPAPGSQLQTNLRYSELEPTQEHLNYPMCTNFLTSAFLEPINLARRFLNAYVAIGPVRVIPDFDYVPNPNPEQRHWSDGRAAWDLLHRNPKTNDANQRLVRECNRWLSDEDKLNTGYELKNWSLFESLNNGERYEDDSHYLVRKRHLLFMQKGKQYPLAASQLGTGISQVIPVLAAALHENLQLISVEQPELHLHPRFQVELGDLFLSCSKDRSFLIETHSEHLVLRLLRRIRERNGITPDQIAVVYLSAGENGVVSERQVVTEDGDFEHNWPDGFFDERDEELF